MIDTNVGSAQAVAQAIQQLKDDAEGLKQAAAALGPLAKEGNHADLGKLDKAITAVQQKLDAAGEHAQRGRLVLQEVLQAREERETALRERLGADLKAACADADLALRVVNRDGPLKLRIPPFAVTVDREAGSAVVEFAQITLESCAADAAAIVAAHARALDGMGSFDPEAFFGACLRAWKAAVATGHGGTTQRVEVASYMPYLALETQGPSFRNAPSASNFADYGRARFAFDVMRLREARRLSQDGWRMNLGVATGTTASSNAKSKVLWIENQDGEGEYKLNVFFTRQEGASDA